MGYYPHSGYKVVILPSVDSFDPNDCMTLLVPSNWKGDFDTLAILLEQVIKKAQKKRNWTRSDLAKLLEEHGLVSCETMVGPYWDQIIGTWTAFKEEPDGEPGT